MRRVIIFCFFFICIAASSSSLSAKTVSRRGRFGARIIGGEVAHPVQFPFAAAIFVQTTTARNFCSGTLLSNLWVLTAGQCVDGATLFEIYLGSIHLADDPEQIEVATSTYVLHPEYDPFTLDNDIGLIRFRAAVTFTDYIKPIDRLPLAEIPDFVSTSVFGWGQVSDDDPGLATSLQWAVVVTITNAECSITYGSQITERMVCVEGNFNQGTCYGDTGSSLIQYYRIGEVSHATPVAVASFVSYNGCETTDPSGFTRTYPYNAWIRNVTFLDI